MKLIKQSILILLCGGLAACQSTSDAIHSIGSTNVQETSAPGLPSYISKTTAKKVHIGRSYTIKGKKYYPKYNESYDETGIASWYGPGFHGKKTANGETYNQYDMTAAHPTLPLPSIVRVTNVRSGKTTLVRVNDRGPFAHGRIIDLSKKTADTLGIKGIAKVRVTYLKAETEAYWADSQLRTKGVPGTRMAFNAPKPENVQHMYNPKDEASSQERPAPIMSVSSSQVTALDTTKKYETVARGSRYDKPIDIPPSRHPEPVQLQSSSWNAPRDQIIEPPAPTYQSADRKPAMDPPPVSSGYFIQAGAFSSKSNANRLRSKLSHIGEVVVDHISRGKSLLYRVRVGPYNSHGQASDRLHEVFKLGIKDAAVIAAR